MREENNARSLDSPNAAARCAFSIIEGHMKQTVFVRLLNEGTEVVRPVEAEVLGQNKYRLLALPHYVPEDECWELAPGSVVQCALEMRAEQGTK